MQGDKNFGNILSLFLIVSVFDCFFQVICAAGGQQEHHPVTQTRSGGVIKTGANRRQHIKRDFG